MDILFAVDLSEPETLTQAVQDFVQRLKGELLVIHVGAESAAAPATAVDPMSGLAGFVPYTVYDPELQKTIEEAEANAFTTFLTQRFTIPVRAALRTGNPADVILKDAEDNNVDLIILGKHHHSRLERFLLGSVATELTNKTSRPTLIMPIQP